MKKIVITLILASTVILVSSCSSGYTCPTYMKMDDKQMEKTETIDSKRV